MRIENFVDDAVGGKLCRGPCTVFPTVESPEKEEVTKEELNYHIKDVLQRMLKLLLFDGEYKAHRKLLNKWEAATRDHAGIDLMNEWALRVILAAAMEDLIDIMKGKEVEREYAEWYDAHPPLTEGMVRTKGLDGG